MSKQNNPTLEEIEDAIPEERKSMSFGREGESIIDVMERSEGNMHEAGQHPNNEHPTCPRCKKAREEYDE